MTIRLVVAIPVGITLFALGCGNNNSARGSNADGDTYRELDGGRAGGQAQNVGGENGRVNDRDSAREKNAASGGESGDSATRDADTGGTANSAADSNSDSRVVGRVDYTLPPPSQCHNQDFVDYQEGCIYQDENSVCGGVCTTVNACMEDQNSKGNAANADTVFICPRFMLFSPEMTQAAVDDGNEAFNYTVVGHDADQGSIDGSDTSTCCQCYQLIYANPSPYNDRQVLKNPDDQNNAESAVPIPKPLIVQSFNTAATRTTFDVYLGGGGFGAHNGCGPGLSQTSTSGEYLYQAYPEEGGWSGGIKPVTHWQECKTNINWVTEETLSSNACQARVKETCNKIVHADPRITDSARNSCIQANQPESLYHLNWSVYVRKVECPEHLTQVTGCRLAPQGLPEVDDSITTARQAAADPSFWAKSSEGRMYETTTMEDCCRPSCASVDWIAAKGLKPDAQYNAFYSCDINGVPFTESLSH
ncbi:MAG: hypothetical protein JXA30_11555 [Deltaproteobacteria bacterium]|nr:hypothetical protein [Deltaproteobacteria bacterium]